MVVKNIDDEFDPNYYMNKYPDVKAAYGTNSCDLYTHFKTFGVTEGRFPNYDIEKQQQLNNPTFSQNYLKFNGYTIKSGTEITNNKKDTGSACRQYCNDLDDCAGFTRNPSNKTCNYFSGSVYPNGGLEENSTTNTFIREKINNTVCDAECERQKKIKTLEEKYKRSLYNYETAPERLKNAKKKYIIVKNGEPYYQELYKRELNKRINSTTEKLVKENRKSYKDTSELINEYKQKYLLYDSHLNKYLSDIHEKNEVFNNKLYDITNEKELDIRKSYYQSNEVDSIKWYSYFFTFIYYIIFVVYLALFIFNGSYSNVANIIILLLLLFFPLIWFYVIVKYILIIANFIYYRLPKDVYYDI